MNQEPPACLSSFSYSNNQLKTGGDFKLKFLLYRILIKARQFLYAAREADLMNMKTTLNSQIPVDKPYIRLG